MKQCAASTSYDQHSLSTDSDDDDVREYAEFLGFDVGEIDVANTILELPIRIPKFESPPTYPIPSNPPIIFTWNAKRKRSVLESIPSSSQTRTQSPPSSSSPNLQKTLQIESEKLIIPKVKPKASSPATPLSFEPSESDEQSKQLSQRKSSKKKKIDDLLKSVKDLTDQRDSLRNDIDNMKLHCNELVALNMELKARKQELCSGLERERIPQLGIIRSFNHGTESGQPTFQEPGQTSSVVDPVVNQTAYGSRKCQNIQYPNGLMHHPFMPSGSESRIFNHVGPVGIPDLNAPQPFDLNRYQNMAKAAEARQRRMRKMKEKEMKNPTAAIKQAQLR